MLTFEDRDRIIQKLFDGEQLTLLEISQVSLGLSYEAASDMLADRRHVLDAISAKNTQHNSSAKLTDIHTEATVDELKQFLHATQNVLLINDGKFTIVHEK